MQEEAQLPENLATERIAEALAMGAREAGGQGAAVLMIVQPGERNSYDQQARVLLCHCDGARRHWSRGGSLYVPGRSPQLAAHAAFQIPHCKHNITCTRAPSDTPACTCSSSIRHYLATISSSEGCAGTPRT